jgi:serine phosphatase RsbU (regulator of sigma subunit)
MLLAALLSWFFLQEWVFQGEGYTLNLNFRFVAFVLVLIVLMLELKDKLLAHDEIQVARQVQLELLPRQDPRPEGWELWSFMKPANHVGGDLVDYVDLGHGRLGITLGDVAGKGLGAALLMAKLQATLRALAPACVTLADLGTDLNLILHRDGLPNRFATLFYLEVQAGTGTARYLNAGHNPVYLLRGGDGTRAEKLEASGLPLGMLEPVEYKEGRLELASGDLILVYSDGLTEAENAAGEEFGNGRLEALFGRMAGMSPDAAGALIIEEVTRFMGERKPLDDLSLVLARRTHDSLSD